MLGQTTKLTLAALTTAALVGSANAATFSAVPYHAYSDTAQGAGTISPFSSVFGAISTQDPNPIAETTSVYDYRGLTAAPTPGQNYFFLEDFTDGQFDVPGVTVTASSGTFTPRTDDGRNGSQSSPSFTDNVDEDDGANDNAIGSLRGSFRIDGVHNIRFTFDELALGMLPTHVGIVRVEQGAATLTAYDADDNVLESVTAPALGTSNPDLTNDHFVGIFVETGIAYVEVTGTGNNEYDHFQYGALVPEPSSLALLGLGGLLIARRRRG